MSAGVQAMAGGHERIAYTIEHRGQCILITGEVPMSAFGTLTMLAPKNAVMDPDAARMLGVTFAMGPADELASLKAARAEAELHFAETMFPQLSVGAQKWLATGERGASSEALFSRLTGVNSTRGHRDGVAKTNHPYNPEDFRRCRLMLEACPELAAKLNDAAGMSPEWKDLIYLWSDICATMDDEVPDWRDPWHHGYAPNTHSIIKRAIGR